MVFLETERLLFRSHEPQDEDDFIKMHTDPEVRRYVGGQPWPVEKAIDRFRTQYLGKPKKIHGLWATVLKEEQKYVGCCGLRIGRNNASIGFYIARAYWRRGIASEAARAFINVAFERLQLPRISAEVENGNAASEHILAKFGFKFVREEQIPSSARIICHYRLLKSDWKKRTA
jgi:[ribosomal protein S5]-alanine N-acetyltransferase